MCDVLRVVTVSYRTELGRFDAAELCQLTAQHTVVKRTLPGAVSRT